MIKEILHRVQEKQKINWSQLVKEVNESLAMFDGEAYIATQGTSQRPININKERVINVGIKGNDFLTNLVMELVKAVLQE